MEDKENGKMKIKLTKERATAIFTLYCRAVESMRPGTFFYDKGALEAIQKIDYKFDEGITMKRIKLGSFKVTLRAKSIDEYALEYLKEHPDGCIVQLASGLDDRFHRIDNGKLTFFDLDFPDSIEIHKKLYHPEEDNSRHHYIASDVTNLKWMINWIKGLWMYVSEENVKNVFAEIHSKHAGSIMIMDVFSNEAKRTGDKSHFKKKLGAVFRWTLENDKDIEKWNNEYTVLERRNFYWDHKYYSKMNGTIKCIFNMACFSCGAWKLWGKKITKPHRIICVQFGQK